MVNKVSLAAPEAAAAVHSCGLGHGLCLGARNTKSLTRGTRLVDPWQTDAT